MSSLLSLLLLLVCVVQVMLLQVVKPIQAFSNTKMKHIVVVGGGIQGTSVAYQLIQKSKQENKKDKLKVTILESKEPASAASGKGGGFMARSWGDGSPTQPLHHIAFDMYEDLAKTLQCESYRKLPVISVSPEGGGNGVLRASQNPSLSELIPSWLDGQSISRIQPMGYGDDTAQITPKEFVHKMIESCSEEISVVLGSCTGMVTSDNDNHDDDDNANNNGMLITGVRYHPRNDNDDTDAKEQILQADAVVVSAGPWSCQSEDWFEHSNIVLPMEGVKSTSIVWKKPDGDNDVVDPTALFCGEDDRFQTHLEVYPRPDGTIYICGIGGSDYVTKEELKAGAFNEKCTANEGRALAAKQSFQEMSSSYKQSGELLASQACMRPCPPDALPYMGAIPNYTNAYINAGHNCWGIAWSPACGKIMAELILNGTTGGVDLDPFDPGRFSPQVKNKRGGRGRKRGTTNVGEQW